MSFPKYPEIVLVSRRPEIFSVREVVATEKLHGSTFRVHFPMGMASIDDVKYGSHDTEETGHGFALASAAKWFRDQPDLLRTMWDVGKSYGFPDFTLFGEACGSTGSGTKMKGVKYTVTPGFLFRAFGVMVGENFVTYDLFCEIASKMALARVPEVWRGAPSMEAFDALLEKASAEGLKNGVDDPANLAEGVVIQSNPLLRTVFGEWLIVKHKGKKFSEVAHAPAAPKERGMQPADVFVATYVTEGRVTNAVGRLNDRGAALKGNMTDMPVLIAEIIADLHKECAAELVASGAPEKSLQGAVSKVVGPIYRQMTSAAV